MGTFLHDPVFKAFSSDNFELTRDNGGERLTTPNSAPSASTSAFSDSNESFPTGSRLFSYIQQPRKISVPGSFMSNLPNSTTVANNNRFGSYAANTFECATDPVGLRFDSKPSSNNNQRFNYPSPTNVDARMAQLSLGERSPATAIYDTSLPRGQSTPSFNNVDGFTNFMNQDVGAARTPATPSSASSFPSADTRGPVSRSPACVPDVKAVLQESIGGTTYFFNPFDQQVSASDNQAPFDDRSSQPSGPILPNFYVHSGTPSYLSHYKPRGVNSMSFFTPNEMKADLIQRHLLCMSQADPEETPELPHEVDCYHQLVPLETTSKLSIMDRPGFFGVVTSTYKAVNTKNGLSYCLRRVHNYRLTNPRCLAVVESWKKIQHSNIVQIREVFTTKTFGDNSVVFVYDYYPGAETLRTRHFRPNGHSNLTPLSDDMSKNSRLRTALPKGILNANRFPVTPPFVANGANNALLPEPLIWCYIVQLSSALRQIHLAGLAARSIDPSKLLFFGKSRLLVNCCGILDVLTFEQQHSNANGSTQHYQQEDLLNFGRMVLALASNNLIAVQRENWQSSIELVARNYSQDLKNLILYLMAPQRIKSVNDVMPMIGARFYTQLESEQMRIHMMENELSKEVENGRLFRLLCKLGAINERPEFSMDSQWSETGDRYLLKLFRDYLFHQVTEDGRPWMDMAHVVQCLNKLDAGVAEKIMLVSRDQQSVLVVSYADLRRCMEQAFNELLQRSEAPVDSGDLVAHDGGQFNAQLTSNQ